MTMGFVVRPGCVAVGMERRVVGRRVVVRRKVGGIMLLHLVLAEDGRLRTQYGVASVLFLLTTTKKFQRVYTKKNKQML